MKQASFKVSSGIRLALAVAAISLLASQHAVATNLFWSANGTTQGGAGTWTSATTPHFATAAAGTPAGTYGLIWNNAASPVDSAEFGGTAGQVNITSGIVVNLIKTDTTGYIIGNGNTATSNAMTFSGANSGITTPAAGTLTTIQTAFTGTLTKAGGGRLEMGNGFNPNANSIKYVITAGDITTASIARLSAAAPTSFVPDFITFDGGGWAINTGSQDTGANRGITIKAGGAFFGTSSTTVSTTVSSVIAGTAGGGLTVTNAGPFTGNTSSAAGGQLILTAVNTYDGPTTIANSTSKITVDADATLGNGAGLLTLNGGTLVTSASRAIADVIANPISMTASSAITTTSSAGNVNFIFSSNTVGGTAGTLTLRNDGADAASDVFDPRFTGSGFNFARPIDMPDGTLASKTRLSTFNVTGTTNTFSGVISGTGSIRRSATSPDTGGDTVLSGNNTYSGGTLITGGGIGFGSSTDAGLTQGPIGTGTLTVNSSSASLFADGAARVVSNPVVVTSQMTVKGTNKLELSGTVSLGAVNRTITVTNTADTILSGVISDTGGTGGIIKQGGGVLILSGKNTYGTVGVTSTTVTAGTLLVNTPGPDSGTGVGNVLVNGGKLGGTGRIGGSVTVTSGDLSPGASINVLDIGGNLTMSGGAFDYEINSSTATADLNTVSGNLSLSTVALSASELGSGILAMGTKFTLINYGGNWNGGTFTGLPNYSSTLVIGANRFAIKYNDTTGGSNFGGGSYGFGSGQPHYVTITAVPEASTFLVIGLGGVFAFAAVRLGKRMGINVLKA